MAQYWYIGARLKESRMNARGFKQYYDVARWVPTVYNDPKTAAEAAAPRMAEHPGVAYFIQGFESKLVIDAEGYSTGFEDAKKGVY